MTNAKLVKLVEAMKVKGLMCVFGWYTTKYDGHIQRLHPADARRIVRCELEDRLAKNGTFRLTFWAERLWTVERLLGFEWGAVGSSRCDPLDALAEAWERSKGK